MNTRAVRATAAACVILLCAATALGQDSSWVVVDSAGGADISNVLTKPLCFDPTARALALVYRGPFGASGIIGYSYSTNLGSSWQRGGELHAGIPALSRYPSAAMWNPTGSPSLNNLWLVYGAAQLVSGSFGAVMYGIDGYASGSPYAVLDQGDLTYGTNVRIWGAGNWAMWAVARSAPHYDYYLWRTSDYVTIPQGVPPTWGSSNFVSGGIDVGAAYRNGASYFGAQAKWPGEPGEVWNVGYSKSSDNGATWSSWIRPLPDWRSIPRIASSIYDDWWDLQPDPAFFWSPVEMVVDASSRVHFFGIVEDTLTHARALVEILETAAGWDANFVTTDLKPSYGLHSGMGHHLNASITGDGTVMAIEWLDAPVHGDSLADVWVSFRPIGAEWTPPQNITATPTEDETLVTTAPVLDKSSNSYTVFLARRKEIASPYTVSLLFRRYSTNIVDVAGGEGERPPSSYGLEQNYPNPFNPVTNFQFSIANSQLTTLKVYDVLGREVATLVNEVKQPGAHTATWDASNFPSGVYFYKMQAGHFVDVKKMLLVK